MKNFIDQKLNLIAPNVKLYYFSYKIKKLLKNT